MSGNTEIKIKLTPSEEEILLLLSEYGRGTWGDLKVFFPRSERSLSRALASLEEKGLVRKIALPGRARKIYYELSEKGEKVIDLLIEDEKKMFLHGLQELLRQSVIVSISFKAKEHLSRNESKKAEEIIRTAFAEISLYPILFAIYHSENSKDFEEKLRKYLKLVQPVVWTAAWALLDISKKYKQFFKDMYKKMIEQLEKRI